ncbi:MAG: DNA polymerase I [Syntrophobacterales bacterium]|nr:MAG: DNA polymerase I [Syntrophobacterales bacterium]
MPEIPRLFLIDGSSYIYRAFYAIGQLSTSKGFPTNAIFGFTSMLLKILREMKPEYVAVVFDAKGPTFRDEIYSDYKANRPGMPEGLEHQIPYIKRIIEAYSIPVIEKEGYEADDIIGTIAKETAKKGVDVVIVTGDKDMLQLVGEHIRTLDTMKGRFFGAEEVVERYAVKPEQMTDIMALMGDSTDNIPGVPGIGEKTAVTLIKQYKTLENLLANRERVPKKKLIEALIEFGEQAKLSKRLATISTDVPLVYNLEDFVLSEPDMEMLKELFRELEFSKFLKEITSGTLSMEDYHIVTEEDQFSNLVGELKGCQGFTFDFETTSRNPMLAELVGLSFSFNPHQAYYIPLGHRYRGVPRQLDKELVLSQLKPLFEDEKLKKNGQNIKYEYVLLKRNGIELRGIGCDTMVASYLLNPTKHNHNLEEIAREYLDHRMISYKDVVGSGKREVTFDQVDLNTAKNYSCEDSDVTFLVSHILLPKLADEGLEDLFDEVEIPLIEVLAHMEMNGVKIDRSLLEEMSNEFESQLAFVADRIYRLAGEQFNINSSQQLGKILFEKLQLPEIKRTKTGASTDTEVLTKLAQQHDLPLELLAYRSLSKLKSTYIDALPKLINPRTGRVHTSYNQTVTATGRLSSSDPNLQNIPIRSEEGKRIRQAFIPAEGWLMLSADYSQIELRILAHLTRDDTLCEAFHRDEDIHARTASSIFGVHLKDVTLEMRRQAKVINFGIIYGMSAFGLGKELDIEPKVASAYIEGYFQKYQGVKDYIDFSLRDAREKGYVTTILGRRRYLPEINSSNQMARSAAERTAINTPIQGTAADLIKGAMIKIHRRLKDLNLSAKMIMQVHDELVFECPEGELKRASQIIREGMEGVMKCSVPLKVSIACGRNWDEAH